MNLWSYHAICFCMLKILFRFPRKIWGRKEGRGCVASRARSHDRFREAKWKGTPHYHALLLTTHNLLGNLLVTHSAIHFNNSNGWTHVAHIENWVATSPFFLSSSWRRAAQSNEGANSNLIPGAGVARLWCDKTSHKAAARKRSNEAKILNRLSKRVSHPSNGEN